MRILFYLAVQCLILIFCSGCSDHTPAVINTEYLQPEGDSDANTAFNDTIWEQFTAHSDSLLQRYDLKIRAFKLKMNEPKSRVLIVKKRRDMIQAEYKLEKLREKLQNRDCDYREAIATSKMISRENGAFIKEYNASLSALEKTITIMYSDTLHSSNP